MYYAISSGNTTTMIFSTMMLLPTENGNNTECRYEQQNRLKRTRLIMKRFNGFERKMPLMLLLFGSLINAPQRVAARPQDLAEYNNVDYIEKNNVESNYDLDASDGADYNHHDSNFRNQNDIVVGDQEQQDEIADLSDRTKTTDVDLATTPATVEQHYDSENESPIVERGEEWATSKTEHSKEASTISLAKPSEELLASENESSNEPAEELSTFTAKPNEELSDISTVGSAAATLKHVEQLEPLQDEERQQKEHEEDETTTAMEDQSAASVEESLTATTANVELGKTDASLLEESTTVATDERASEEADPSTEGMMFVVGEETTTLAMKSTVIQNSAIETTMTTVDETSSNIELSDDSVDDEKRAGIPEENEEHTTTGVSEEIAAIIASTTESTYIKETESTSESGEEAAKTLSTNQMTTFIMPTDENSIVIEDNVEESDNSNMGAEGTTTSSNESLISETLSTVDLHVENGNVDANEGKEDSTAQQEEKTTTTTATTTTTTEAWTVQRQQHQQQYTQQWWTTTAPTEVRSKCKQRVSGYLAFIEP